MPSSMLTRFLLGQALCARCAAALCSSATNSENGGSRSIVEKEEKHQRVRHDVSASRFVIDLGRDDAETAPQAGEDEGEPDTEAYLAYT
eukprot:6675463-Pyramimonas_sp.AAC.2